MSQQGIIEVSALGDVNQETMMFGNVTQDFIDGDLVIDFDMVTGVDMSMEAANIEEGLLSACDLYEREVAKRQAADAQKLEKVRVVSDVIIQEATKPPISKLENLLKRSKSSVLSKTDFYNQVHGEEVQASTSFERPLSPIFKKRCRSRPAKKLAKVSQKPIPAVSPATMKMETKTPSPMAREVTKPSGTKGRKICRRKNIYEQEDEEEEMVEERPPKTQSASSSLSGELSSSQGEIVGGWANLRDKMVMKQRECESVVEDLENEMAELQGKILAARKKADWFKRNVVQMNKIYENLANP